MRSEVEASSLGMDAKWWRNVMWTRRWGGNSTWPEKNQWYKSLFGSMGHRKNMTRLLKIKSYFRKLGKIAS